MKKFFKSGNANFYLEGEEQFTNRRKLLHVSLSCIACLEFIFCSNIFGRVPKIFVHELKVKCASLFNQASLSRKKIISSIKGKVYCR